MPATASSSSPCRGRRSSRPWPRSSSRTRRCRCRRSSIRNPDENHEDVLPLPAAHATSACPASPTPSTSPATSTSPGALPAAGVDAAYLDQLLGVVLDAADEPFNELLVMGFLDARCARSGPGGSRAGSACATSRRSGTSSLARATRGRRPDAPPLGCAAMTAHTPRPAAPRRVRLEPEEPLHRLGRRRPHREGPRRGGRAAGELLREAGLLPDVVHTSVLRRAITTANLALDACDRHWIPVRRRLAAQRAALRRAPGPGQGRDAREVRRRAVHALAPLLRHPAAADRGRHASTTRPATRATPASRCRSPSASRTSSRG